MELSVLSLVSLSTNVTLPVQLVDSAWGVQTREGDASMAGASSVVKVPALIGHGLGARNPGAIGHMDDSWTPLLVEGAALGGSLPVLFTARGHKGSLGWQETAESDAEQFTWSRLAHDMYALATEHMHSSIFVASGSSMGGATALYTALHYPKNVLGVIMIRPPTAWETRRARRKTLLSSANKCRDKAPEEPFHLVLRGAALADLPPLPPLQGDAEGGADTGDDQVSAYACITCPVLLLAVKDDESHPLDTAEKLHELLPISALHVADDLNDAKRDWPRIIAEFISSLPPLATTSSECVAP